MDISEIDSAFTEDTEPEDKYLIELLKRAYKGEILCTMATADLSAIEPFSDYRPTISNEYRSYFKNKAQEGLPSALHVYAKHGKLIMSDDYSALAMHKELSLPQANCIVIGDTPEIKGVTYHGDPFQLPPPIVKVLDEPELNT